MGCPLARLITAFLVFGIGGLIVPLALLFSWLKLRARPNTSATVTRN